jgi:replication factor C subunit 1
MTISKKENSATADGEKKKAAGGGGGNKFYAAFMRREGPKNPGSKPIPIGKKNCFNGLKFLVTGVLDSIERDDCKRIVEQYGGQMTSGITKKLDYLIVGSDAGQSKLDKAKEMNIKMLNEDEFLQLICTKSRITNPKYEGEVEMLMDTEEMKEEVKKEAASSSSSSSSSQKLKSLKIDEDDVQDENQLITKKEAKTPEKKKTAASPVKQAQITKAEKTTPTKSQQPPNIKQETQAKKEENHNNGETELWVEKYRPKQMTKIIGQLGEKSNANKLFNWLKNWQKYHGPNPLPKKSWNDQDTGTSFKCALLSGPPGIGKTTTAQVVCKEAGYTFVEFNASDSRSKKLLDMVLGNFFFQFEFLGFFVSHNSKEKLINLFLFCSFFFKGESCDNKSLDNFFKRDKQPAQKSNNQENHCIIMDEVDGMAGNEDRGGIQELISIIKQSKIPVICICNDRQHIKIRSLANYCFDLRFYKPGLQQIRAALMSVCFKEAIKITPDVLDQIIVGANYDIRQCLNNLSMWSSTSKNLNAQSSKADIEKAVKDIRMNPFEACKQTFSAPEPNKPAKSIPDRMELFFTDYSLMPLLVHENYLSVRPENVRGNTKQQKDLCHLNMLNQSIESICEGDRIGRLLRTNNNWSLLTPQCIFSTVVPGAKLTGSIGLPAFPSWFGKNSKQTRVDRILQELQKHMRIHISANKLGVGMDYLSVLKTTLTRPLIKQGADGIPKVIELMNNYSITREDFDTILELATWPGQKDLSTMIESKVKAAFTRQYNKEAHKNPFTLVNVKKLKGAKLNDDGYENEEEAEVEEDEENDDDVTKDAMIKVNTKSKASSITKSAVTTTAKAAAAVKRAAKSATSDDAKPSASKKRKQ